VLNLKNLFIAVLLVGSAPLALSGKQVWSTEGTAPGPHVMVILPAESHPQVIGLARQLTSLDLQSGKLTIVETADIPAEEGLSDLISKVPAGDLPDWVWIHRGRKEGVETPTLSLAAHGQGDVSQVARTTLGPEVSVERTNPRSPAVAKHGTLTLTYPSQTPPSRQNRYTRELAVALLRDAGMIGPDTTFHWGALSQFSPRLIALYDAEGIGGGGPVSLEKIAATRIEGVGIYRVCGEDIRDGALPPAISTIFPGGSGRGIGNGLQEEGRDILRAYISGGGGYLGVCAGAYFAASGLDTYLQAIDLKHSQPWMRGRSMVEIELTDEGKKLFGGEKTLLTTRYANGPVFLPGDQSGEGDPNFMVLARFTKPSTDRNDVVREEMVGEAAIGSIAYGKGRILIISPHPESHEEHFDFVARAISWTMAAD
jgi:hypothetical protein